MRAAERDSRILEQLAAMPFLDRLELAAVCNVSEGLAHNALASLGSQGLVEFVKHGSPLTIIHAHDATTSPPEGVKQTRHRG